MAAEHAVFADLKRRSVYGDGPLLAQPVELQGHMVTLAVEEEVPRANTLCPPILRQSVLSPIRNMKSYLPFARTTVVWKLYGQPQPLEASGISTRPSAVIMLM